MTPGGDAGGAGAVVDVAIVGAGAAGLAAAKTARAKGLSCVLLEASHRIGGRAYTEELALGVPFDLGCHWMHSASLNPFTKTADELGFPYETNTTWARELFLGQRWSKAEEDAARMAFIEASFGAAHDAGAAGRDVAVADVTDRDSPWTAYFDYVTTLYSSVDSDQQSVFDGADYRDTDENWPVKHGYGALVARWGADVPVALNTGVARIDWGGREVVLDTPKGSIRARTAIVTVSTGILAADRIRFDPPLPERKRAAIDSLVVGNHNRIGLLFDKDVFGPDVTRGLLVAGSGDDPPMGFQIRPFGFPFVVGVTGGRFATWLERAGVAASVDHALERLKSAFGTAIGRHVGRTIVTAWGSDPWTLGAYSALRPGQGRQRAVLAESLEDRLYFAGEATSTDFFSTCHGARITGETTVAAIAAVLDRIRA